MNPNTPIHEYGHVWVESYAEQHPEEWKKIIELPIQSLVDYQTELSKDEDNLQFDLENSGKDTIFAGDVEAAEQLVHNVVKTDRIKALAEQHPNAVVAFTHAEEATGTNKLPEAYANQFKDYGLATESFWQSSAPHHTGSDKIGRLIRRSRYDGEVVAGKEYIIVDDHVTKGGTLRDLKDYIESKGGKVVAVSTLSASAGGTKLTPTEEQIKELEQYGLHELRGGKETSSGTRTGDDTGENQRDARGREARRGDSGQASSGAQGGQTQIAEQLRQLGIADNIYGLTKSEVRQILLLAKAGEKLSNSQQSFQVDSDLTPEEQQIKQQAQADGTYMQAPNGEPTHLTEKQWLHVRTRAFKDWFGDWEADHDFDSTIKKQTVTVGGLWCYLRDSGGIRTRDPQLRRLLLYPTELPNLEQKRNAKLRQKFECTTKNAKKFCLFRIR